LLIEIPKYFISRHKNVSLLFLQIYMLFLMINNIYKLLFNYVSYVKNRYRIISRSLSLWVWILFRWGVLDTTLCGKACQWLATGQWFSPGTPVSSTNKTDHHNITEILLKVALNTITLTPQKIISSHFCYLV
jgi:hypothetical protein